MSTPPRSPSISRSRVSGSPSSCPATVDLDPLQVLARPRHLALDVDRRQARTRRGCSGSRPRPAPRARSSPAGGRDASRCSSRNGRTGSSPRSQAAGPVSGSVSSSQRRRCSSGALRSTSSFTRRKSPAPSTAALNWPYFSRTSPARRGRGSSRRRGSSRARGRTRSPACPRAPRGRADRERPRRETASSRRRPSGVEAKLDLVLPRLVEAAESDLELGVVHGHAACSRRSRAAGSPNSA